MTWNKGEVNEMQTQKIRKNHMDILWHEYTDKGGEETPVTQASLTEKASIVGRVGIMLLSCGTGAWRVRSSMNALAEEMGITCTADIGLMSIEYTCFDGDDGFRLKRFTDYILQLHWEWQQHWRVADLHFCLVVD